MKKLAAVESAAENEMALKEGAGIAKNLEDFVLCHRGRILNDREKMRREKPTDYAASSRVNLTVLLKSYAPVPRLALGMHHCHDPNSVCFVQIYD